MLAIIFVNTFESVLHLHHRLSLFFWSRNFSMQAYSTTRRVSKNKLSKQSNCLLPFSFYFRIASQLLRQISQTFAEVLPVKDKKTLFFTIKVFIWDWFILLIIQNLCSTTNICQKDDLSTSLNYVIDLLGIFLNGTVFQIQWIVICATALFGFYN